MKRPISINSFLTIKEKEIEAISANAFDHAIASISVGWAYVEIMFDYTNLYMINTVTTDDTAIPIGLKPKIAFYKKHFNRTPELAPFSERANKIVESANLLKVTRHDIVHGVAIKQTPSEIRRYMRIDYRGKRLIRRTKQYSLDDVMQASSQIFDLGRSMGALARDMGIRNLRQFIDNPDG